MAGDGPSTIGSPPPNYDDLSRLTDSPGKDAHLPVKTRLTTAIARQGFSPKQLVSLFFPLGPKPGQPALLPMEQVVDVLEVDLGVHMSKAEERDILRTYGKVTVPNRPLDVEQWLDSMGLWPSEDELVERSPSRGGGGGSSSHFSSAERQRKREDKRPKSTR